MPTKLVSICQPAQDGGPPAECWATFTVDGQHGNLKYLTAGIATLQADDPDACSYLWEVTSSPPHCDYILTGSTQPTAKLTLPGSGAYVVQLTVSKGDCVACDRAILWVATPRHLYRIPADGEALRFDGDEEWAGDLARVIQEVDWSLPTPEQKAALDGAHRPGEENPFATLDDLTGGSGGPCELTADEIAAIKEAEEPGASNPFLTEQQLTGYLSAEDKAAIEEAEGTPGEENPFITKEQLDGYLTAEDKAAIEDAEGTPGGGNPFVTTDQLGTELAGYLSAEDKAAIEEAEGTPGGGNPFVTTDQLGTELGSYLSAEDKAAIEEAEGTPGEENPFITKEQLDGYLTEEDKAAIEEAEGTPGGGNPFITTDQLGTELGSYLTAEDKAAIEDAEGTPGEENPFVTKEQLDGYLTEEDKAAIEEAEGTPGGGNPFITTDQLGTELGSYLTAEDKAAIEAAEGTPSSGNPFVTREQLETQAGEFLTSDDRAAIVDADGTPSDQNPFVTTEQLDGYLSADDKGAIEDAEGAPSSGNPFITREQLETQVGEFLASDDRAAIVDAGGTPSGQNPFITTEQLDGYLSAEDRAAIVDAEGTPGGGNPFVTTEQLETQVGEFLTSDDRAAIVDADGTPSSQNPFVTAEQLDGYLGAEDKAAIVDAEGSPSGGNPFVTKEQLDGYLTDTDKAAIVEAQGTPSGQNPFVTANQLGAELGSYLSADDKAAIEDAEGTPGSQNPFVATDQLDARLDAVALSPDQKKALDAADQPGADNEYVTRTHLERVAPTGPQKQAMDGANDPSDQNPFATVADLGQAGVVTRIVAAGTVDLSVLGSTSGNGLGGLEVVDLLPERGVATIHFDGYQRFRAAQYVINTLPVRTDAKVVSSPPADPLGFRQFIAVQFVAFNERGFELQMIQPLHQISGVPALGPCMIEVAEVVAKVSEPVPVTLEQAIKRYYQLIQKQDYAAAWPMLSEKFRTDRGLTFERYVHGFGSSGPAILISIHRCEVDSGRATLVLDLDFPFEGPAHERKTHLIRYGFVRDQDGGHPRFGHWLFVAGREVELEDEVSEIWDRLTGDERDRLGHVQAPCTPEITAKFTLQRFERGLMYWFEHPASAENIWVLYEPEADYMRGASWRRYVDDWPGVDEFSCDEARANGPNGPVRGFGWLWCVNTEVRQAVGDPVDREAGSGDDPSYSRGVFFEGGVIFFRPRLQDPVNTTNQGIVLINGRGWRRLDLS